MFNGAAFKLVDFTIHVSITPANISCLHIVLIIYTIAQIVNNIITYIF